MYLKFIFAVFLSMSCILLCAQDKVKKIALQHDDPQMGVEWFFGKVVDARPNKEFIGQAQTGLFNKKVSVAFEKPFETEIKLYLNSLVPPHSSKESYTMVIHKLWISEKTTMTAEKGMMEISLEILKSAEFGEESFGIFNHFIEKGGMDVTGNHEARIREGFMHCINEFISSDKEVVLDRVEPTRLNFTHGVPKELNDGFYATHASLIANTPIDTEKPIAKGKRINEHVHRIKLKSASNNKRVKHYAYHSGGKVLLNTFSIGLGATHYLENATEGTYLVFVDKYSRPGAAAAFGAIGAAASNKTRASILDMNTGTVREIDDDYLRLLLVNHESLWLEYQESDKKVEDQISIVQKLNDHLKLETSY